jgi:D-3-phosphoglycerate dehydrogenase
MSTVVVSDTPIVDPDRLREAIGDAASVAVADTHTEDAVIEAAASADALVVDDRTPITARVLDALAPTLGHVARAGTGVDNVDCEAAADAGVVVTRVPGYATDEVATHAVALLLGALRSLRTYDRSVRAGDWSWTAGAPIARLHGATVGIVACGPIGRAVADRLGGFGVARIGHDPYVEGAALRDHGIEPVGLDVLADRADHLISTAPLTDETRGLIGADVLDALPDHAVVVNVGRGGVVDEAALAAALDTGEIGGAGLDVLASEPPEDTPLLDREDVLLTPHTAFYTEASLADLNDAVAADVRAVLRGETPENTVA